MPIDRFGQRLKGWRRTCHADDEDVIRLAQAPSRPRRIGGIGQIDDVGVVQLEIVEPPGQRVGRVVIVDHVERIGADQ